MAEDSGQGRKLELKKQDDRTEIKVDDQDITDWVQRCVLTAGKGYEPQANIEVDMEPVVELDSTDVRWRLNLPEEKVLRKAIYEQLRREFEEEE